MRSTNLRSMHTFTATILAATCLLGCDIDTLDERTDGVFGESPTDYVGPEAEPLEPLPLIEEDGMLRIDGSDFRVRIHRSRRVAELNLGREHLNKWYSVPFSRWSPEATARLYEVFADDFDFIVLVPASEGQHPAITVDGDSVRVRNDVTGLGLPQLDETERYGSAGRLQHAVLLGGIKHVVSGPSLRELGERWGNAFVPTTSPDHFGFADVGGLLGGCSPDTIELIEHDTAYYCDYSGTSNWSPDGAIHNDRPYARLELYLMGLIGHEGLPPITWADDGEWLDQDHGIFTGTLRSASIDELLAEHGKRFPASADAQRHFRTLFVVVSGGDFIDVPLFDSFDRRVAEFAAPHGVLGEPGMLNFFEAASGLAKLDAEALDDSLL